MIKNNEKFRMVATTLFGLEQVLAEELTELGAEEVNPQNRSVEFWGNKELLYKANLWSRLSIRILLPFKPFMIYTKDDFYQNVMKIDWLSYINPEATMIIDSIVNDSRIFNNSMFVSQLTKDAIVDQIREKTGKRPSIDLNNPDLRINVHINKNKISISLDSSGEPLYKRGYRTETVLAPINEVLAAGIIKLSGWDMKTNFVDAMCGSGTFAIEAAMMARKVAPGLFRKQFGFMLWKDYEPMIFKRLKRDANNEIQPELPFKIIGSDISWDGIRYAKSNAIHALVDSNIRFEKKKFEEQNPPKSPGILIINPPYDNRMPVEEIDVLYKSIGDTLKQKYEGYDAFVFTGNLEAAKSIGLRPSRKIALFNSSIECKLLKYEIYKGAKKDKYNSDQGNEEI